NDLQLFLRRRLADHVGRLPLGTITHRRDEIESAVRDDVHALHALVAHTLLDVTALLVAPLVAFGVLAAADWRLALLALLPRSPGALLFRRAMAGAKARMAEFGAALGRVSAAAAEYAQGIAVVRAFGRARTAHERLLTATDAFAAFFTSWVRSTLVPSTAALLVVSPALVLLLLLAAGAPLLVSGNLSGASLLAFVLLGPALAAPLGVVGTRVQQIRGGQAAATRVSALLATPALPAPARPALPAGAHVSFRDVSFSYDGERDVLAGVDLDLAPGTVTALVGPSGAGKSTLAALLARFHDVTGGAVTIGGADVRDIPPAALYRSVGFVLQDVRLLRASVADNIRLGRPSATDEEVERAARAAHAHEMITALPHGYATEVGTLARFSGGEAQRVSIARALLARRPRPGARRGDRVRRPVHRGAGPGRALHARGGPHRPGRGAPSDERDGRRPHRRPRRGPDRGERPARRTPRGGRAVRAAVARTGRGDGTGRSGGSRRGRCVRHGGGPDSRSVTASRPGHPAAPPHRSPEGQAPMIRLLRHVLGAEGYRPLRRLLAVLLAAAVLQGLAFALLVPVLRALLGGSPDAVWPWLLALAAVTAAFTAAQAAALAGGFTVGGQLSRALHRRLADHTLTLPVGWFSGGRAAELARIAGPGVMQVMNMPAHLLRPLVSAVVTPAVLVAASFCFDVRVGCVLLAFLPVLLAAHRASTAVVARLDRGRDAAGAEAAERVMEYTRNQPVLRAFGRTSEDHGALDEALAAEARADRRLITRGVPGLVAFAFVARAVLATVLVLTVHWTLDGSLDVPTLLALLVLTARLTEGVSAAADLGAGLRVARHSLEHVAALLDEPPFPVPAEPRVPDGYSVRFHDVDFSYASGTDPDDGAAAGTLRGVAFTAPEGSVTALVGPSGAGKTTVARLLARFWDVTGGSVTIGGVDVRDMAPDVLAATVSPVFQDTYLFDGTVEENVLAGKPGPGRSNCATAPACPGSTGCSPGSRRAGRHGSAPRAPRSPAASGNASRSPARCCATRPSSSWTRPRPRSTRRTRPTWSRPSAPSPGTRRCSSSPTASAPSETPTASSSWSGAGSPSAAPTRNCSPTAAPTRASGAAARARTAGA
ncbi:ABC-type multidrug transport system, ATPase and permease component, partial [Streptomyces sp. SolWspMP-sol7th]